MDNIGHLALWLLMISTAPALIGFLCWKLEKIAIGFFGVAIGLGLAAIYIATVD